MMLKTAMLAPMPKARMRMAMAAKARSRQRVAEGVTNVAEKRVEERKTAGFAMCFLRLLRTAEADASLALGFLRRHSVSNILFDGELEMRRHLFGEILVERLLAREGLETEQRFAEREGH